MKKPALLILWILASFVSGQCSQLCLQTCQEGYLCYKGAKPSGIDGEICPYSEFQTLPYADKYYAGASDGDTFCCCYKPTIAVTTTRTTTTSTTTTTIIEPIEQNTDILPTLLGILILCFLGYPIVFNDKKKNEK